MTTVLSYLWRFTTVTVSVVGICSVVSALAANSKPGISYWNVDDVRAGMKGIGRTAMQGTTVESFDVEVLGVLKNVNPGRDLVLCRLSGLNLEKTGVIAGMSGSPVYIDGKLLGAVAYAWSFGKEPIAGITPFGQMRSYVAAHERRDLDEKKKPTRIGLRTPIFIDQRQVDSVTVSHDYQVPGNAADGLCMTPLQTPLAATGMTDHTLHILRERCGKFGWLPVQGGGAGAKTIAEHGDVPFEAGSPLAVALIRGDFDLSGIGTVTHVDDKRVYGWGHPFLSVGMCEFPLMSGYIHAVYPRQTVSFKIGSPLKTVGTITADVSTGIAGWLDRTPELLPVRITVNRQADEETRTFNVEIVRQRSLVATLLYTALTNSVDMEGDLPEELTADLTVRIYMEGRPPVVISDTYSGPSYSGGRAPTALYTHVASLVQTLIYNPFEAIRLTSIECDTSIQPGRRSAEIETVELSSDVYSPGERVKATVWVRPHKGAPQKSVISLALPGDMPEGVYTATVCDEPTAARAQIRDNPTLHDPQTVNQLFENLRMQTAARRTNLALRVVVPSGGVALEGQALPNLPASMVHILGTSRRTGAQAVTSSIIERQPTPWVLTGSETVRFAVMKNKKITDLASPKAD